MTTRNNNELSNGQRAMKNFLADVVLKPLEKNQKTYLRNLKKDIRGQIGLSLESIEDDIKNIREGIDTNEEIIGKLKDKTESSSETVNDLNEEIGKIRKEQKNFEKITNTYIESAELNQKENSKKFESFSSDIKDLISKWEETEGLAKEIKNRVSAFEEVFESKFSKQVDMLSQSMKEEEKENRKVLYLLFSIILIGQVVTILIVII